MSQNIILMLIEAAKGMPYRLTWHWQELLSCEPLSTPAALVLHKQWILKRVCHKTELLSLHKKPNII
jgi:hypothetical protein